MSDMFVTFLHLKYFSAFEASHSEVFQQEPVVENHTPPGVRAPHHAETNETAGADQMVQDAGGIKGCNDGCQRRR